MAVCQEQLMGDLPSARVEYARAFLKVGVDYAGPFLIHLRKGRGAKTYKAYVCVFVCMSTKATHLELVSELTTDAFLAALKRFMNKRGICSDIYSDNGTNFVGAARKLTELFAFLRTNYTPISEYLLKKYVSWHFNPPATPHAGGIWEAAVKAMKYHLKRTIGQRILTLEEMITLLSDVEAILNSRPISVLSSQDIDALTPAHFIIFHPLTQIPEVDLTDIVENRLTRWQLITQLSQHFWTRWSTEYLTSLQKRTKWHNMKQNIEIGDIIIIRDEQLPQTHWLLGRIEAVHPGKDGLVRVVSIKTKGGVIKRPIQKVCKLPVESSDPRPAECSSPTKL